MEDCVCARVRAGKLANVRACYAMMGRAEAVACGWSCTSSCVSAVPRGQLEVSVVHNPQSITEYEVADY